MLFQKHTSSLIEVRFYLPMSLRGVNAWVTGHGTSKHLLQARFELSLRYRSLLLDLSISTALTIRRMRVSSFFASVIQFTYSFLCVYESF